MIESICIQDEACYGEAPQTLDGLLQHNFIFGSNATGKTTISRIIDDETVSESCSVTWHRGDRLETFVYNVDFVTNNFSQSDKLKGIFTLGEESKDTIDKIASLRLDADKLNKEIQGINSRLLGDDESPGKKRELEELEESFEENCWELKQRHDEKFKEAFKGYRNSKVAFKVKLLSEAELNSSGILSLADLEGKAKTVFGKSPDLVDVIPVPDFNNILELESNEILKKKIVGKDDVDIAAMIQKLGNSDWVRQGRSYYENNNKICPFCQQLTTELFANELAEYFDETFENDTKSIQKLNVDYKSGCDLLMQYLHKLIASPSDFVDEDKLKAENNVLEAKINLNVGKINEKLNEPSKPVELESLSDNLKMIKGIIGKANSLIEKHNTIVENLIEERGKLTGQVWRYLLEAEIKNDLARYKTSKDDLKKAINGLESKLSRKRLEKEERETEIRQLEKNTTSVQPAIDGINSILKSFGFNNFKLAKSGEERYYKIIRPNGEDVKKTLSEGEKNFITFLYFYYLLKGSENESGVTTNRVVVFDDPVSSLDSNVLFVVSSLIREIIDKARAGNGSIKQVFVLTHNIFFHKEVTYNRKRNAGGKLRGETFWILRKSGDTSVLAKYDHNPIKTSYELLWMEIQNPNTACLTIQNIMRRIIEYYFTILGNVDPDGVCSHFEGKEKQIAKSLFSWVNAGSHITNDDIYISIDNTAVGVYLDVFRKVFEKTNHISHYNMMMGIE